MKNSTQRGEFLQLIRKYLKQKATQQEIIFLEKYYRAFEKETRIMETAGIRFEIAGKNITVSQLLPQ